MRGGSFWIPECHEPEQWSEAWMIRHRNAAPMLLEGLHTPTTTVMHRSLSSGRIRLGEAVLGRNEMTASTVADALERRTISTRSTRYRQTWLAQ